jgi:hypothetical protein
MLGRYRAPPLAPRELFAAIRAVRTPLLVAERGRVLLANDAAVRRFGDVEGAIVPEETPASRSLLGGDREVLEYDLV